MDIKPTTPSDEMPCTCTSMDQYVDGLCPGCIEAADRAADLNDECIYPQPTGNWEMPFLREDGDDAEEPREGDDDRYYSGSGESMDDDSYTRYLNRG
jgi:hypothetical protein